MQRRGSLTRRPRGWLVKEAEKIGDLNLILAEQHDLIAVLEQKVLVISQLNLLVRSRGFATRRSDDASALASAVANLKSDFGVVGESGVILTDGLECDARVAEDGFEATSAEYKFVAVES